MPRALFFHGPPPTDPGTYIGACTLPPRLSPWGRTIVEHSIIYYCPTCGTPWGTRIILDSDVPFLARPRPCHLHGGGNFFEDRPIFHDCSLNMTSSLLRHEMATLARRLAA